MWLAERLYLAWFDGRPPLPWRELCPRDRKRFESAGRFLEIVIGG